MRMQDQQAWIVKNRKDPKYKKYFSRAYGKRPLEELYDLKKDPYQMNNVARESGMRVSGLN